MKVKLRTMYSGPRGNCGAGCVIDLPDNEAQGLIDGGYAEAEQPEVPALGDEVIADSIVADAPEAPAPKVEAAKNPGGWSKKGR